MKVRNLGHLQDFDVNAWINRSDVYREHWETYESWGEKFPFISNNKEYFKILKSISWHKLNIQFISTIPFN